MLKQQLNTIYADLLKSKPLIVEYKLNNSIITFGPKNVEAIALKPASALTALKVIPVVKVDSDFGLIRVNFGYSSAAMMVDNFTLGVQHLSIIKNLMEVELAKYFNPEEYEFSFERPGRQNEFFIEMDDYAGFELRLFCKLKQTVQGEQNV